MAGQLRSRFSEPESASGFREAIGPLASALHGWEDLDPLLERIGDSRYVLLGEASICQAAMA